MGSNHIRIYDSYFGYDSASYKPCEICGGRGIHVHHIDRRGMGGRKSVDVIENLMRLCLKHHNLAEAEFWTEEYLSKIHLNFMKRKGI